MAYIDIPHKDNTTPLTPTEWNYLVDKLNARRIRDIVDVEDADPVTGDMLQHNGSGWIYWDITGEYYNKDEIDAILVGDADIVGSTVQSITIDAATGVFTLKQEEAPDREVLLKWDAFDRKAEFSGGVWTSSTYQKDTFTREGDYLGIALRETTDHLAPQYVGDPFYTYQGDAATQKNELARHMIVGTRFTPDETGFILGYQIYTIAGQHYSIFTVENPGPDQILREVLEFQAENTGVQQLSVTPTAVTGTAFDILYQVETEGAQVTETIASYDYDTPPQDSIPVSGQVSHSNTSLELLRVSKFDNGGADQSAMLEAFVPGDRITMQVMSWTVTSVTDAGTYMEFTITPDEHYSSDGIYDFTFIHVTPADTEYFSEVGYWSPYPNAQGFISIDEGYDDVVLDQTYYGIDVLFQQAVTSEDWFILAVTGGTSSEGGEGGVAIDIIDDLTTPRTDAALSANMGVYIQSLLDLKANIDHTLDSHSDVNVPTPLNGQLLTYDDETLSWVGRYSYAGLGFVELNYKYTPDDATPNAGFVSTDNNTDPSAVTTLYMNKESASGNDLSPYLVEIKYGDWLNYHLYDDFDSHQKYDVLGPAVLNGDVFEIPVSLYEVTGTTLQNNDKLGVLWRIRSAPVGLGTDDVTNQSGVEGTSATDALNSLNANKQENSIPITIVDYPYVPVIEHNAHYIKAQDGCELITLSQGVLPIGFNQIVFNDSLSDVIIESGDTIEGVNEPIPPGQQGYYVITEDNTWSVTTPVNLEWILPRDIQIVKPTSDYTTQTDESGYYVMAQDGCAKILLDSTDKGNGYNQIVYNQSASDVVFESSVGSIDGENNSIPPDGQGHYVLNSGVWTVTTPIIVDLGPDEEAPIFIGKVRAIDTYVSKVVDTEAPKFIGLIRAIDESVDYEPELDTEPPIFVGLIRVTGDSDGDEYVHPVGPGYYHMPAGGTVGQVIKNTTNGNGTWQDENTGDGLDETVPVFTGVIRVRVDREELAFINEENIFSKNQTLQDISTKRIEARGMTMLGFTDSNVQYRAYPPGGSLALDGSHVAFFRGSIPVADIPTNNNDVYADFQAVRNSERTGVDYVAPVMSLSSEGKSSVHLVGASAVDGGVSYINSRLQVGFNQWLPTLSNTRMLAINGDVGAAGFYQDSLREMKENITPFIKSGLDIIDSLDIVNYDYKQGYGNQIGIIIDDSPEEVANNEHDAVDLMKMVAVQAKAIQELSAKVTELQDKFEEYGF